MIFHQPWFPVSLPQPTFAGPRSCKVTIFFWPVIAWLKPNQNVTSYPTFTNFYRCGVKVLQVQPILKRKNVVTDPMVLLSKLCRISGSVECKFLFICVIGWILNLWERVEESDINLQHLYNIYVVHVWLDLLVKIMTAQFLSLKRSSTISFVSHV